MNDVQSTEKFEPYDGRHLFLRMGDEAAAEMVRALCDFYYGIDRADYICNEDALEIAKIAVCDNLKDERTAERFIGKVGFMLNQLRNLKLRPETLAKARQIVKIAAPELVEDLK